MQHMKERIGPGNLRFCSRGAHNSSTNNSLKYIHTTRNKPPHKQNKHTMPLFRRKSSIKPSRNGSVTIVKAVNGGSMGHATRRRQMSNQKSQQLPDFWDAMDETEFCKSTGNTHPGHELPPMLDTQDLPRMRSQSTLLRSNSSRRKRQYSSETSRTRQSSLASSSVDEYDYYNDSTQEELNQFWKAPNEQHVKVLFQDDNDSYYEEEKEEISQSFHNEHDGYYKEEKEELSQSFHDMLPPSVLAVEDYAPMPAAATAAATPAAKEPSSKKRGLFKRIFVRA